MSKNSLNGKISDSGSCNIHKAGGCFSPSLSCFNASPTICILYFSEMASPHSVWIVVWIN